MKFIIFFSFFVVLNLLFFNVQSRKHSSKNLKHKSKAHIWDLLHNQIIKRIPSSQLVVYKNYFYNSCFLVLDCNISSNNCKDMCEKVTYDGPYYNCDDKKVEFLSNTPLMKDGKLVKDMHSENFPFELRRKILRAASCIKKGKGYSSKLETMIQKVVASPGRTRIRLINGFIRDEKRNFYDIGEDVIQFYPQGKKFDLKFAVDQLNKSYRVLSNSIREGSPNSNKLLMDHMLINLNIDDGLFIRTADLMIEPITSNIYHQGLYICATGKDHAYHFYIDRAARDPTHEHIYSTGELFRRLLDLPTTFTTLVRITLYEKSNSCDRDHTPDKIKYNPEQTIMLQGNDRNDIRNAHQNSMFRNVPESRASFKKLYTAIQRFAIRFNDYVGYAENCQHFATGFYNYLTKTSSEYPNSEIMFSVNKEPFDNFFTDETDEEYLKNVEKRRGR